jgi:alpha-1,6-mannosyltransferase
VSSLTTALPLPVRAYGRAVLARFFLACTVASSVFFALEAAAPGHMLVRNPGHVVPLPDWFTGPLADLRIHSTANQQGLALLAMCVAYLGLLAFASHVSARQVVFAIVSLNVLFALAPPLMSSDVFNYIDYGRFGALHGLDPYTSVAAALPGDPVYPFVGWRHAPTVYGPLFTVGSYPLALLSPAAALWSFKAIALLSSLSLTGLVWKAAERVGRPPVAAAAAVGLNPILLAWAVGGAHNDLLMLAVLLGGMLLVLRSREVAGGAALLAAVAIKATAGLALPFVLIGASRRARALAGVVAGAAFVGIVALVAFPGHELDVIHNLSVDQRLVSLHGVPNEVTQLFGPPRLTTNGRHIAQAVFLLAIVWLIVRVSRRGDWISTSGWALLVFAATSPWFLAWYSIWPLPLAALARDRRLLPATLLLQGYVMWNTLPRLLGH